jgi:hypothetical protein
MAFIEYVLLSLFITLCGFAFSVTHEKLQLLKRETIQCGARLMMRCNVGK